MTIQASLKSRITALVEGHAEDAHVNILHALETCADHETTTTRLEHYLDAAPATNGDWDRLAQSLEYARLLLTILDQSDFLTHIIGRRPEFVPWLADYGDLRRTPPVDELEKRLAECTQSLNDRMNALRVFRQREMLRIAARDIVAHAPLREVALDLANLADAAADSAWRWSREELEAKHGVPQSENGPAQFVVLGMGKLGGRELNFSSDIDLIFLFSDDGETTGGSGRALSNHEYFHRMGERIFKYLNEETVEGRVFRVDMRLRPHGGMAPLAISLDSALTYYQQTGQAWERQALIKVRAIAGDVELGDEFIANTRPFVFPKFFF